MSETGVVLSRGRSSSGEGRKHSGVKLSSQRGDLSAPTAKKKVTPSNGRTTTARSHEDTSMAVAGTTCTLFSAGIGLALFTVPALLRDCGWVCGLCLLFLGVFGSHVCTVAAARATALSTPACSTDARPRTLCGVFLRLFGGRWTSSHGAATPPLGKLVGLALFLPFVLLDFSTRLLAMMSISLHLAGRFLFSRLQGILQTPWMSVVRQKELFLMKPLDEEPLVVQVARINDRHCYPYYGADCFPFVGAGTGWLIRASGSWFSSRCQTSVTYVICHHVARRICGVQMSYVSHVRFAECNVGSAECHSRLVCAVHVTVCL